MKFSEEITYADQIFIGKVIKKTTSDMAYYLFSISQTFKGDNPDTITIKTGFGGTDCGMEFETGKEYLVFSHDKRTSRCRRNAFATNNPDINKLRYLLNKGFSATVGETINPDLTENEANYFNSEFSEQRKDFDFLGKRVAFVSGTSFIDKKKYFKNYGGNEVVANLVTLTEEEKLKANGYDAIIVLWRKQGVSKSFRKKLIKRLT